MSFSFFAGLVSVFIWVSFLSAIGFEFREGEWVWAEPNGVRGGSPALRIKCADGGGALDSLLAKAVAGSG